LLTAAFLSQSGDAITQLGVPWLVLLDTGSAEKAGFVALCTMLPSAASALLGGGVVDRAGARWVSILSDVACGLTLAAVPVLQLTGLLRFWLLCGLMAAAGLLHAPGDTARAVLLPALARRADVPLSRSVGWFAGASRAASIVGAAAGGVLIASFGAAHVLFIDAGTFAVSASLIAFGTPRPHPKRPGPPRPDPRRPAAQARRGPGRSGRGYRRDLHDGIRFVATTPLVLGITVLTLLAQILDQGWSAVILPVDVRDKLHSILVLGTAETGFAVGALAGAAVYSMLADRLPRWPLYTLGFIIVGMPRFAVAALTRTPAPLVTMMTIEGLACGPLNPIAGNVIYQLAPEPMRGRVIGSMTAVTLLATPFGALAAGVLIGALGLTATTILFGGIYLVVTLVPAVFPLYRQLSDP
jgi:MFS family permease